MLGTSFSLSPMVRNVIAREETTFSIAVVPVGRKATGAAKRIKGVSAVQDTLAVGAILEEFAMALVVPAGTPFGIMAASVTAAFADPMRPCVAAGTP